MKTKVTIEIAEDQDRVFPMSEMEPGQICIICNGIHKGSLVMRTRSSRFEVIDLTDSGLDSCWTGNICEDITIKQAPKGTKVIFEVI